jgi:hypothetical protein
MRNAPKRAIHIFWVMDENCKKEELIVFDKKIDCFLESENKMTLICRINVTDKFRI